MIWTAFLRWFQMVQIIAIAQQKTPITIDLFAKLEKLAIKAAAPRNENNIVQKNKQTTIKPRKSRKSHRFMATTSFKIDRIVVI